MKIFIEENEMRKGSSYVTRDLFYTQDLRSLQYKSIFYDQYSKKIIVVISMTWQQ